MQLLSVNVGLPRDIVHDGKTVSTGIFKAPVSGRVMVRRLNLDGDKQADLRVHGGVDKAVYVYPFEHYAFWREKLGREDFSFGQFGENFTTVGLLETDVAIGDVFQIGGALVQVTQPRVPCFKLGHRMAMPAFLKLFLQSERSGFYLRVLQEGEVGAGDSIRRVEMEPERLSVHEVHHLMYFDEENIEGARKALRVPALASGWRESFVERVTASEAHS